MKLKALLVAAIVLCAGAWSSASMAAVWYVDARASSSGAGTSWATPFTTIQEAVSAASAGDEVWVRAATYNLSAEILVNKAVTILGGFKGDETAGDQRDYEKNQTVVDGRNNVRCFHVTGNAVLRGFTLIGGRSSGGGAVYVYSADVEISHCIFYLNQATSVGGALYSYGATLRLVNCQFRSNEAPMGAAVALELAGADTKVTNNTFYRNSASVSGGAIQNSYASPEITNTLFWRNRAPTGSQIANDEESHPQLSYCLLDQDGYAGSAGMIREDPAFVSERVQTLDLRLWPGSPAARSGICGRFTASGFERIAPYDDLEGDQRVPGQYTTGCSIGADEVVAIVVDEFADELNSDGDCSLREAVRAANLDMAVDQCRAGSGRDMIELQSGKYTLAVAGREEDEAATGDLDLLDDLAFIGTGDETTTISGEGLDRIFDGHDADLVFAFLTMEGGVIDGGGRQEGGCLALSQGSLSLEKVVVHQCLAGWYGGGIYSENAALVFTGSRLEANEAQYFGGGLYLSQGSLSVQDCTFETNMANGGAGLQNENGTVVLDRVTFSGNVGGAFGNSGADGELYGWNLTVSGNVHSPGHSVDAIENHVTSAMVLENVTVASNGSNIGDNIPAISNNGSLTIRNSIVAGNGTVNCNFSVPLMASGNNIEDKDTCGFNDASDLVGEAPELGPLRDNGGFTRTHAILPGSPAVNRGDDAVCPDQDQRAIPRPSGEHCDIGAVESESAMLSLEYLIRTLQVLAGYSPNLDGLNRDDDVNANERLDIGEAIYILNHLD